MDQFDCSLSQFVHLCIEANLFLDQLHQFELQFTNFDILNRAPANERVSILDRLSMILHDLNVYHQNYFLRICSKGAKYLARPSFTMNESEEIDDDFEEEFHHLNYFLRHRRKSNRPVFDHLHRLNVLSVLWMQYRRFCTKIEVAERFVHLRMDLLMDLKRFNEELHNLLMEINLNFQERSRTSRKIHLPTRQKANLSNLYRTICLWSVLAFVFGFYLLHSTEDEKRPQSSWFL